MTNLFNKFSTALSNTLLLGVTVVMAGLGFAFVGTLALFGLIAVGVAMIAAPFVAKPAPTETADETDTNAVA